MSRNDLCIYLYLHKIRTALTYLNQVVCLCIHLFIHSFFNFFSSFVCGCVCAFSCHVSMFDMSTCQKKKAFKTLIIWLLTTKIPTRVLLHIIPLFRDPREQEVSWLHFTDKETKAREESNLPKDDRAEARLRTKISWLPVLNPFHSTILHKWARHLPRGVSD